MSRARVLCTSPIAISLLLCLPSADFIFQDQRGPSTTASLPPSKIELLHCGREAVATTTNGGFLAAMGV